MIHKLYEQMTKDLDKAIEKAPTDREHSTLVWVREHFTNLKNKIVEDYLNKNYAEVHNGRTTHD